jgi:SAM dependent carboxyl methyltransferase
VRAVTGAAATQGMADDYDAHSQYQRAVADTGTARIVECVDAVAIGADETFLVADYGASTGANSMAAVRSAIEAVRKRNAAQPVAALHNDLPTNDWNALFRNVESSPDSYRTVDGPAVISLASAISFFEPAAPSGAVHLGMSFSAAHWLRTQPSVVVPEGFYFCEATGDARAALAEQADRDWTAFLAARAADLTSGGRLLVQMVGTDGGGNVTARKLARAMAEVAGEMARDGQLDADAVKRYIIAAYARTVAEARAPYAAQGSPLHDSFTEIECRTDPVPNPYFTKWEADHDATAYAKTYAAFVRGFTESSLREHLFAPGVEAGDVDAPLDEFFVRLTARFAADPERDPFEDWTLTVVLQRS